MFTGENYSRQRHSQLQQKCFKSVSEKTSAPLHVVFQLHRKISGTASVTETAILIAIFSNKSELERA